MIVNVEGDTEWVAEDECDQNDSDPDAENYYTHDYGDEPPSSDEVMTLLLLVLGHKIDDLIMYWKLLLSRIQGTEQNTAPRRIWYGNRIYV